MKIGAIEITETDVFMPVGTSLDEGRGVLAMLSILRCKGSKAAAAQELCISEAMLEEVLRRYFGEHRKDKEARR